MTVKKRVASKVLETYSFRSGNIPVQVVIEKKPEEFIPVYEASISQISKNTEVILDKIRDELIEDVNLGMVEIRDIKKQDIAEERFRVSIQNLVDKYFPDADDTTRNLLVSYVMQKSLGLGSLDILLSDPRLEEIAVNSSNDYVQVYHRKHGWLKTNIKLISEDQIRHYATMIGRKVGRQVTIVNPLMDATLEGHRVNATLMPISNQGNTITIRKFASKPWTITDFISSNTISAPAAAFIWTGIQYELSTLVSGGTATGKTSMLNVISNFFPPNQRIISIEDTREIQLPSFLHWVPMLTRLPNNEGKGEVTMLNLLINALRQRPDRIIVGEIRRKREAEALFEAIHTGHSVCATVHANNTKETITRLMSPPIEVPQSMIPGISMIVVQHRNRRTGIRRTFEVSEVNEDASPRVLMRFDPRKDILEKTKPASVIMKTLNTFTGMSTKEINHSISEKTKILKWLVKQSLGSVEEVGRVVAEYYTNKDPLMKCVKQNKPFGDIYRPKSA